MRKLLVLLFSTAGSAAGWWLGARVAGIMTAFVLSMIGLGVGIWWGARLATRLGQ